MVMSPQKVSSESLTPHDGGSEEGADKAAIAWDA